MNWFKWACYNAAEKGLVTASSGNFSLCDRHYREMSISASGRWLGDDSEPVRIALETGANLDEGRTPSTECPIHLEIYRTMPWAGAVLHFQSPYATAYACVDQHPSGNRPDLCIIPEVPYYIGHPMFVPYHKPGSDALVEALRKACIEYADNDLGRCHLIFLVNHGAISVGVDAEEALKIALFAELACRVAYINQTARLRSSTLPARWE